MVVVEVVVGILGSLAVVLLVASLMMAVVGFIGALFSAGIERCDHCGRVYLSSSDGPSHHCPEQHALSLAHVWHDHHGMHLRHH